MKYSPNLYESYIKKGSFFNRMLHCGYSSNFWVQNALNYLPPDILEEHKEKLVLISTSEVDACRVARVLCKERELIILSERIFPKKGMNEASPETRYFTFVVLHEIAHAINKHKSPMFDKLTQEEAKIQEQEANRLAFQWYNNYVKEKNNPNLPILTQEEIDEAQNKNQLRMKAEYEGS